jgi:hypothetical protein
MSKWDVSRLNVMHSSMMTGLPLRAVGDDAEKQHEKPNILEIFIM